MMSSDCTFSSIDLHDSDCTTTVTPGPLPPPPPAPTTPETVPPPAPSTTPSTTPGTGTSTLPPPAPTTPETDLCQLSCHDHTEVPPGPDGGPTVAAPAPTYDSVTLPHTGGEGVLLFVGLLFVAAGAFLLGLSTRRRTINIRERIS